MQLSRLLPNNAVHAEAWKYTPSCIYVQLLNCPLPPGVIDGSVSNKQVLDRLPVERERGITVKAQTATMFHRHEPGGTPFMINLIDTPVSYVLIATHIETRTQSQIQIITDTPSPDTHHHRYTITRYTPSQIHHHQIHTITDTPSQIQVIIADTCTHLHI